jgi:hypothetical protein
MQSNNVSNQKSKTLKDEIFILFSYFMMMAEFEYHILFKKINEKNINI